MELDSENKRILKPELSKEQVNEICNEIELQWERHLLTRFFSNSQFPRHEKYSSRDFKYYHVFGNIEVKLPPPNDRNPLFNRAAKGLGYWHNQNFVIRLFGIINKHKILAYGKQEKESIIVLLDKLRNNVGAHQSGATISDDSAFKQSLHLIVKLFRPLFNPEEQQSYPLAVDHVLKPLKDGIKEYVRNLELKKD